MLSRGFLNYLMPSPGAAACVPSANFSDFLVSSGAWPSSSQAEWGASPGFNTRSSRRGNGSSLPLTSMTPWTTSTSFQRMWAGVRLASARWCRKSSSRPAPLMRPRQGQGECGCLMTTDSIMATNRGPAVATAVADRVAAHAVSPVSTVQQLQKVPAVTQVAPKGENCACLMTQCRLPWSPGAIGRC